MLTVFFDVKGVVLSEFLAPGDTVTAETYCSLLGRLRENIQRKRPNLWGRGQVRRGGARSFLLHHDNASSHTAVPTFAYIGEHDMEMLPHPPYSPDLAPCDYFIFPRLKNEMHSTCHPNVRALQTAVQKALRKIPAEDFESALMSMPIRWIKCVAAQGDYFEGRRLDIHPDQFGIETVFGEDSSSSSESEDEADTQ